MPENRRNLSLVPLCRIESPLGGGRYFFGGKMMRKPGSKGRGANTGVIYFLHQWRTVAEVEAECQSRYRLFDRLPSMVRVAINAGDAYIGTNAAAALVRTIRCPSRRRHDHGGAPGRTQLTPSRGKAAPMTDLGSKATRPGAWGPGDNQVVRASRSCVKLGRSGTNLPSV